MGTKERTRKKLDQNGNPLLDSNGEFINEIFESQIEPDLPAFPDWFGLQQALYKSILFTKYFNEYNTKGLLFTTVIQDGKRGENVNEQALLLGFQTFGINWTDEEKIELNNYLKTYHFTIRI